MLKIGDKAPAFNLMDDQEKKISLKDFKGQPLVLYFYPKDMTPGCTQEACDFKSAMSQFKKRGAAILGVSPDSVISHQKFRKKYALPFSLLADEEHKMAEKYDVWKEKSMYGRKYMGIERSTFIIDKAGKIAHIFSKVKVTNHVKEILNALTELEG